VIKVRIGRPISVAEHEYKTIRAYSEFLRKKTYMLLIHTRKESKLLTSHLKSQVQKKLQLLLMAKNDCRSGCFKEYGLQTLQSKNYEVFAEADKIPNIL
jgi:archaellum component FlaC